MSNTLELKDEGFVEFGELTELVAAGLRIHENVVKIRMAGLMNKVRALLVEHDLVVLPDDRTWSCLYSADLQYFFAAYLQWHRFGERRSVVAVVSFYRKYLSLDDEFMRLLPTGMRRQLNSRGKAKGGGNHLGRVVKLVAS